MKTLIAPLCALVLAGPASIASAAQPPVRMQHPEMREMPLRTQAGGGLVRTAEEIRAGTAWGLYGGMNAAYQGMGGPDESEEGRVYPPCRSRSDDRCQQGR